MAMGRTMEFKLTKVQSVFKAKWAPVRVKKTRQIKNPEPRRRWRSVQTELAGAPIQDPVPPAQLGVAAAQEGEARSRPSSVRKSLKNLQYLVKKRRFRCLGAYLPGADSRLALLPQRQTS
jgi:hypothetical protein